MVDLIPVMDGEVKFRDGKKWKPRFAVVTRLSPVADSLTFQLWKNRKDREMNSSSPTKGSLVFEDFIGIETGFTLDRESLTLAIVLKNMVISLAFSCREVLMRWKIRISSQFECGRSFNGSLIQSPFSSGPIRIHVQNDRFYITSGVPPSLIHSWKFTHLRRYGNLKEHQFVFEGGSQCEKGEGIHIIRLPPHTSTDLKAAFDLGAKGKLPGKKRVSNGDSAESRSISSNGSYYRSGLSQFSSSCDTMSDVLSEMTMTTTASSTPEQNYSDHLVNRRSLLERIYSFADMRKKSGFDPTWNMKKEFSKTNNHESLIFFDDDAQYDNPRGFDKVLPRKVGGVFDNYDIPKTIPTSSLYDVPRSLRNVHDAAAIYQNVIHDDSPTKVERVRLNGSGKMPVVDMRKSGLISNQSATSSYINVDRPSIVQSQHHLYENILPSLGACLSSNYDTINIKLRKFHDMLNDGPKEDEKQAQEHYANLDFSKRKSLSLSSVLEDELSAYNLKESENIIRNKRRISLS